MSIKALGEITGVWALVAGGFADIDMAWVAAFLAAVWSGKLIVTWLYGLIRKRWPR